MDMRYSVIETDWKKGMFLTEVRGQSEGKKVMRTLGKIVVIVLGFQACRVGCIGLQALAFDLIG